MTTKNLTYQNVEVRFICQSSRNVFISSRKEPNIVYPVWALPFVDEFIFRDTGAPELGQNTKEKRKSCESTSDKSAYHFTMPMQALRI